MTLLRSLRLLFLLIAVGLIATFTVVHPGWPTFMPYQDKLYHACGFFVLTIAVAAAFPSLRAGTLTSVALLAAALVELVQAGLPERTGSVGDFGASMAGILLGVVVCVGFYAAGSSRKHKAQK